MGDLKTLAKARMELEELYLGIPDDSVDLTFQDFAEVQHKAAKNADKKHSSSSKSMKTIAEETGSHSHSSKELQIARLPSLDFSNAFQASKDDHSLKHHPLHYVDEHSATFSSISHHQSQHHVYDDHHIISHRSGSTSPAAHHVAPEPRHGYDDFSMMSRVSAFQDRGSRRRPGVPHSNICTVCSTYIYLFRHRCLVCGRVYCRQCVVVGMAEMTEGRKCIQCLGRRFSQRYIQKAGEVGCCGLWYAKSVRQAELMWAEKGPRRSGERAYGRSSIRSRSRTPVTAMASRISHGHGHGHGHDSINPPSFVASSTYSPYTPTHHHLPF